MEEKLCSDCANYRRYVNEDDNWDIESCAAIFTITYYDKGSTGKLYPDLIDARKDPRCGPEGKLFKLNHDSRL